MAEEEDNYTHATYRAAIAAKNLNRNRIGKQMGQSYRLLVVLNKLLLLE